MDKNYIYIVEYSNGNSKENLILKTQKKLEYKTINGIISTIFKSLNKKFNQIIYLEDISKENIDKYLSEYYLTKLFSEASKTLIYYDEYFKTWKISYSIEPRYNLLDYIKYNKKLKLYLVGDSQISIFKDNRKLSYIEYFFKKATMIDNCSSLVFNNRKNNSYDLNGLYELLDIYKEDTKFTESFINNFEVIICFDRSIDIFMIEKFLHNKFSDNIHICLNNGIDNIKQVEYKNSVIKIYDKVTL